MPAEGQLSKRYMVMFGRQKVEKNLQFFKTGLNVVPIIQVFWYRRPNTAMKWKAFAYVVAEEGHRPWDTVEAHVASSIREGKPKMDAITEFTADEFAATLAEHPESWYDERAEILGKLVYEPFDEERSKAGESWHWGIHHPKKAP